MPVLVAIIALAAIGAVSVTAGVYVVAGLGPALICTGGLLFAGAAFLRSGLTPNG